MCNLILINNKFFKQFRNSIYYVSKDGEVYSTYCNKIIKGLKREIKGKTSLVGKHVKATDLRGGASLVVAGLIADGETIIDDADHILRGYDEIIEKLTNVGAKIEMEEI